MLANSSGMKLVYVQNKKSGRKQAIFSHIPYCFASYLGKKVKPEGHFGFCDNLDQTNPLPLLYGSYRPHCCIHLAANLCLHFELVTKPALHVKTGFCLHK